MATKAHAVTKRFAATCAHAVAKRLAATKSSAAKTPLVTRRLLVCSFGAEVLFDAVI